MKTEVTHSDLKNEGKVNVGKVLWEEPTGRGKKVAGNKQRQEV